MDDQRKVKKFGYILAVVLSLLGALYIHKERYLVAALVLVLALAVFLFSLKKPVLLRPVHRFLTAVSLILAWVNTRLILALLFYLVFAPVGIILKILRKDPLGRKFEKNKASYWSFTTDKFEPGQCERQF